MSKIIDAQKARQGRRGRQVLVVLVVGLILAGIAWGGVAVYGHYLQTPATDNAAQTIPRQ